MVEIKIAVADDWEEWRDLRLAALRDSPLAFGSSYEREADRTEEEWRSWLSRTDGARYIAYDGEQAAGIVAVYLRADPDQLVPELVSMWINAAGRRKGVGRALVDVVSAWVAERGYDEVRIMATYENVEAVAFYERLGFTRTGYVQPLPHDDSRMEFEMSRPVSQAV